MNISYIATTKNFLYCCTTNYCKLSNLSQHTLLSHTLYVAWDWAQLRQVLSLEFTRLQSMFQLGCVLIFSLDWERIYLQPNISCGQNSFPCSCLTEGLSFFSGAWLKTALWRYPQFLAMEVYLIRLPTSRSPQGDSFTSGRPCPYFKHFCMIKSGSPKIISLLINAKSTDIWPFLHLQNSLMFAIFYWYSKSQVPLILTGQAHLEQGILGATLGSVCHREDVIYRQIMTFVVILT